MVGSTALKQYNVKDLNEYFELMAQREQDGQGTMVRKLYNRLSREQMGEFLSWLADNMEKADYQLKFARVVYCDLLRRVGNYYYHSLKGVYGNKR